eukprot:6919103-Pyramimonas_sp.AAC.1
MGGAADRRPDRSRQRGPRRGQGATAPPTAQNQQAIDLNVRLTLTSAREQAELAAAALQTWRSAPTRT